MRAVLEPGRVTPGYATLRLINDTAEEQYIFTATALLEHEIDISILHTSTPLPPRTQTTKSEPRTPLLKLKPGGQTVGLINLNHLFDTRNATTWTGYYKTQHPLTGDQRKLTWVTSNQITVNL